MNEVELVLYLHKVIKHFGGEDYVTTLSGELTSFDELNSKTHGIYHFRPRYCSEVCIRF
jgi:hypothetical protein